MPSYQVLLNATQEAALTKELSTQVPVPTIQDTLQQWITHRAKEIVQRNTEHDESTLVVAIRAATPAQKQEIKTILGI